MLSRFIDLSYKSWLYLLKVLEKPQRVPFLFWHAVIKGVHLGELLNLSRYEKFLKSADIKTVFDVGANTGQFASAIKVLLPDAKIYSFEPIPECYERLTKKFPSNEQYQAFCVALGNEAGKITFWKSQFAESSSILPMSEIHKENFPWTAESIPIEVPVKTLDAVFPELNIIPKVLLKIDVQGYEKKVLEGGIISLEKIDFVLVETSFQTLYEGQATFDEIYRFLTSAGYEFAGNFDQLIAPLDGTILQGDALFVKRNNEKES